MLETLWRITPLGLGAALTPSLLTLQIVASRGAHWIWRTSMVILGTALAFGGACTIFYLGFAQLPDDPPNGPRIVQGILLLAATVVLAGVAIWLFRPHPELVIKSEAAISRRLDKVHLVTIFSIAFVLSVKDITSFALLVPGLHDIATAGIATYEEVALVIFMFVLALLPVLLPPAWRAIRGKQAARMLDRLYDFTMRQQFRIVGILAVVFAIYCLVMSFGKTGLGVAPW